MARDLFAEEKQGKDLFADTGQVPAANDRKRQIYDELVTRGTVPQQVDPMRELAESVGPVQAFLIGTGEGLYTLGRGLGLVEPAGEAEKQAMAALKEQRPYTTTAGQIVGEAAPFAPLAMMTGGAATLGGRAAVSGGLGGLEGALIEKGREGDVIGGAVTGATFAAGADVLFPMIGRTLRNVWRKATGQTAPSAVLDEFGQPTEQMQNILDETGLSFEDVTDEALNVLEKQGVQLTPSQVVRRSYLKEQMEGVEPTMAQVRRDADLYQAQQEAAKRSSKVRKRLEQQEAALTGRFNKEADKAVMNASSPSADVFETVLEKDDILNNEIDRLYGVAREKSGDMSEIVKPNNLAKALIRLKMSDRKSGGNVRATIGDLIDKGVINNKLEVVGGMSVSMAEEARQYMNSLFDEANSFGNGVIRQLKDALDEDVFSIAGKDVYEQARKAKTDYENNMKMAKISKMDSRKRNLVKNILENKIDPDRFVQDIVFAKGWRKEDLRQLKDYTGGGDDWNNLKADVLNEIKKASFIGPEDASGFKALSRNKLEKAIEKIGRPKLEVIFEPEEVKFLDDMLKVARLREPVRGTQQGLGPSAQAIGRLEKALKETPILGQLFDLIDFDYEGRVLIKSKPEKLRRKTGIIKDIRGAVSEPGAMPESIPRAALAIEEAIRKPTTTAGRVEYERERDINY